MRFVVKIGSQLLTNEDNSLNTEFIKKIADQIAELHRAGHQPLIVTSGAVAAGRKSLTFKKETKTIPYRQALAAVGQTFLLDTYRDSFEKHDMSIGQVLLTMADLEEHEHFLSTYNTIDLLLSLRVIPVINENDVTTFNETKFGNNDKLSSHVASLINAKTLILLTDVAGLYDADPKTEPNAKVIPKVSEFTKDIMSGAGKGGGKRGIGGMWEKVKAAEYATTSGVNVWVADGKTPNVVVDLIEEKKHHGTLFEAQVARRKSRRRWLQMQLLKGASVIVDEGAKQVLLHQGKSLLPSGIQFVEGKFKRGDVVSILGVNNECLGFGQVNYNSKAIEAIKGKHSSEIESCLGYTMGDEVINRDNMGTV
ncbi:MAG: glutamate 5-kinase [Candidatus Peregrinibacteria bacterium]|nr:glutamate 5-kinase [Candidatus Peregrinibacteria bacterium]